MVSSSQRTKRNKGLNTRVQTLVLDIVGDGELHDTTEIAAKLMPEIKAATEATGTRFSDGDVKMASTEVLVRSRITRVIRGMVAAGLIVVAHAKIIRGARIFVIGLPNCKAQTKPQVELSPEVSWRDTLEGFQRQARYYLETKQFDRMGLA